MRRSAATCTLRLLSSTAVPGQTASMISALDTRSPGRSTSTPRMSSAREPIAIGAKTPRSSRRNRTPARRSRRKPSNSILSVEEGVSIFRLPGVFPFFPEILAQFITFYPGLIAPPPGNQPYGVPQNAKEGRANMKSWLWKGMLAAAIALPALSGVARAQSSDNDGCTNATLKGDYAFSAINFSVPQVVVGIKNFDGKGKFTQRDYGGDSLRTSGLTDFSTEGQETGTYKVK